MIRNLNQVVELVAILWCMANFFGKKVKITAAATDGSKKKKSITVNIR